MAGKHRKPAAGRVTGRHRAPPSRAHWVAPALVSLAVLAAGGVGAYAALVGSSDGSGTAAGPASRPTVADSTPAAPVSTPSAAVSTPTPAPSPASTAPARPQHALVIAVTGRVSWIEVTRTDGRVLYSGLLRHGHRLAYRNGGLHVVIGDAGAVRLVRHGRVTAPAGRPGQVLRLFVH